VSRCGSDAGSLGPRQHLVSPVLRRASEAPHIARATRIRACLRRERRGDPRRLPSARGRGLATAVEDFTQTGSRTFRLPAPFHVLRWDPPPSAVVDLRLTLPRRCPKRLSAPAQLTGEMLLTDFCNRRATRAPVGFLDSRGDRRACALLTASDGAEPQRTARVKTCLTARHELQPLRCTRLAGPVSACAHAGRRLRMPPDPAGLPIVSSPRDGTPRPRRCLPWDGPNVTAFDTLVATRVRRSAAHAARTAFTMASSKAMAGSDPRRLPSPSASLDHPACAERSRTRDPPPIPRLCRPGPASGAPSPPAPEGGGARPCRFRTLITSGRTWPRAARRLLQSK
jgi:hypothetical protein